MQASGCRVSVRAVCARVWWQCRLPLGGELLLLLEPSAGVCRGRSLMEVTGCCCMYVVRAVRRGKEGGRREEGQAACVSREHCGMCGVRWSGLERV